MMPFDTVFMDIAEKEVRVIHARRDEDLPNGTFLFREMFCADTGCDCRRVILHVYWVEEKQTVASINYAFEPPVAPYEDEGQMFLDTLNPQSWLSETFLSTFTKMIGSDRAYHDRLVRHYTMWKQVVDDPAHPRHKNLRPRRERDVVRRKRCCRFSSLSQQRSIPNDFTLIASAKNSTGGTPAPHGHQDLLPSQYS